jgi:cold shock CspA family protein
MTRAQPTGAGNTISGGRFSGPSHQDRDVEVAPIPAGQAVGWQQGAGDVFISYVHKDSDHVDLLQRELLAVGISVWRDTADLGPGQDWRARIRAAITCDALVFLACFSARSLARPRSYQNEELVLAIEQLRLRPPEDPWLIPVRFDNCQIPDRDIGAGRTLTSLQHADLFGERYAEEAQRLVTAIQRILGRRVFAPTAQGVIKWFDANSGRGFIVPAGGGPDVFVHSSAILADGHRGLREEERVEFEIKHGKGGGKR